MCSVFIATTKCLKIGYFTKKRGLFSSQFWWLKGIVWHWFDSGEDLIVADVTTAGTWSRKEKAQNSKL
jgi:hypothetical protein